MGVEYSITSTTLDAHSIFTLLSTMDWYLEVRIQAEDRQYSSCPLIQETKITKILNILTSLYHVVHNTCITHGKHQDAVYWVDVNLAIRKGLIFYQTRSNAIIIQETLPAYCIPKVVRLKIGEVLYEKAYMSPRPPPKISLKHEWKRELGSEVARQPEGEVAPQQEGEVARQAKFFQPTQPIPNPIRERSGRLDNMQDGRNTSRFQEININSFSEEVSSSERTGRPVATLNTADAKDSSRVRSFHESDTFNVEDEELRKKWKNPWLIMTTVMHQ